MRLESQGNFENILQAGLQVQRQQKIYKNNKHGSARVRVRNWMDPATLEVFWAESGLLTWVNWCTGEPDQVGEKANTSGTHAQNKNLQSLSYYVLRFMMLMNACVRVSACKFNNCIW